MLLCAQEVVDHVESSVGMRKYSLAQVDPTSPDSPIRIFLNNKPHTLFGFLDQVRLRLYKFSHLFVCYITEPDERLISSSGHVMTLSMTLMQGFWPDGKYTAPTDEALLYDIQAAKLMGANVLRKHIKVEPDRFYYHADRYAISFLPQLT